MVTAIDSDSQDDASVRYVAVGDVVAGRYLVESVLGVNASGFVVSARDIDLDQRVALRFLNKELANDPDVADRFVRDVRATIALRSQHVARVHDVGMHEGAPFVIMEHLRGRDLSAVLLGEGRLRVDDAVGHVLHACEGLAAAHVLGIVHRHVRPENLYLEEKNVPCVKVLDLGMSRPRSTSAPGYMSPEQVRSSAAADERSDVWSLGAVLYELLTGTPAFTGVTVTEVCAAVLESTPTCVAQLRTTVPRGLSDVVARAIANDRRERFANMAELASALLPFARRDARTAAERWCLAQPASLASPSTVAMPSAHVFSSAPTSWAHGPSGEILPPPHALVKLESPRTPRRYGAVRGAVAGAALMMIFASITVVTGSAKRAGAKAPQRDTTIAAPTTPPPQPQPQVIAPPAIAPAHDAQPTSAMAWRAVKAPRVVVSALTIPARKTFVATPASTRSSAVTPPPPSTKPRRVDLGY